MNKWSIECRQKFTSTESAEKKDRPEKNGICLFGDAGRFPAPKSFSNGTKVYDSRHVKESAVSSKALDDSCHVTLAPLKLLADVAVCRKDNDMTPPLLPLENGTGKGSAKSDPSTVHDPKQETEFIAHIAACVYHLPATINGVVMTIEESYPNVEHCWLERDILLQLLDSRCADAIHYFQVQWQQSLPVLASNCDRHFKPDLWHPDSFSREYGCHARVDLVDCLTGDSVDGYPAEKFWNAFEPAMANPSPGKQHRNCVVATAAVLRLRDWPPSSSATEDLTEITVGRHQDLLHGLPLAEYTHSSGAFNLVNRIPEFLVRPELGVRVHAGHGSGQHQNAAFSKLHYDLADSVNVMMYVESSAVAGQDSTKAGKLRD